MFGSQFHYRDSVHKIKQFKVFLKKFFPVHLPHVNLIPSLAGRLWREEREFFLPYTLFISNLQNYLYGCTYTYTKAHTHAHTLADMSSNILDFEKRIIWLLLKWWSNWMIFVEVIMKSKIPNNVSSCRWHFLKSSLLLSNILPGIIHFSQCDNSGKYHKLILTVSIKQSDIAVGI